MTEQITSEMLLFFHDIIPLYIVFTPAVVALTSILLVLMMTTPYDSEAARYKEWIKNAWIAWLVLQLCPTLMVLGYNWAVNGDMFIW